MWLLSFLLALAVTACNPDVMVIGTLEDTVVTADTEVFTATVRSLRDNGFKGGANVRYQRRNAVARKEPLRGLASELVAKEHANAVIVFSQDALDAAMTAATGTPIIFVLSGDQAEDAARSAVARRTDVFGVAQLSTGSRAVSVLKQVLPQAKVLGVVYDPSHAASTAAAEAAKVSGLKAGLDIQAVEARDAPQARAAAKTLTGKRVSALYIADAPWLAETLAAVVQDADAAKVPVISARLVKEGQGVLVAFEVNEAELGRQAGDLAARVLKGEVKDSLVLVSEDSLRIKTGPAAAARLGITLPSSFTESPKGP